MDVLRLTRVSTAAAACLAVAACSAQQPRTAGVQPVSHTFDDRECMARAMYFESHRGADEGMVAVGTVVANRKDSGRYGASICDVVGQKRQFAAGVMTRTMEGEAAERARRNADKVLAGHRHPALKTAMFFHTAGYKFRYPNMHYVLVAGGNAFYEKREAATAADASANAKSKALALAYARIDPTGAAKPIVVASLGRGPATPAAARPAAPQLASVTTPAPVVASEPVIQASVAPKSVAPQPATKVAAATAKPAPAKPAETALAYASVTPTPAKAAAPQKRVLQPATLAPALASSAPVAAKAQPGPEPAAALKPDAKPNPVYAYNGEVAAAFAAFETR